ncbi:hypothetical protein QCA50_000809 [Cerrena zonata]|uniref:Cytochrome P450 n=1 Tax=Cerrena zonata TaxID=2478898 RepID=A0AAW0GRX3_9APHY
MEFSLLLPIFLFSLLFLRWVRRILNPLSSLPLPPGPKGYPIIGNLFNVPSKLPWKTFHEWSKIHGDILYIDIPTQPIIVLGSADAAFELLEKRSDIYSDRPRLVMDDLMGLNWTLPTIGYSPKWRAQRRLFHQHFNQHEITKYRPEQLRECRIFLGRLLDGKMSLGDNIRLLYSAIILRVAYDMDIDTMNHNYIRVVQDAVTAASVTRIPGAFWVEFLPFLRYLPDWLPGNHSKKHAKHGKSLWDRVRDEPFDAVKQKIADGKATNTVTAHMLERSRESSDGKILPSEQEEMIRDVLGIAYGAAADTTASAAQSFVIAMSLFPDVQRKAQEELERVVGPKRLPDFSDYNDLIYVQATLLESIRWMAAFPLAFPHRAMQDGEFRGFLIPKGATIFANVWYALSCVVHRSESN